MDPFLIFLFGLLSLLAVFGLVALGFAVPSKPYPPHPAPGQVGPPQPFDPDLPEPVRRHFAETLGEAGAPAGSAPLVNTVVAWGRGKICVSGVWLPLRFKDWYRVGQDSFRFIEVTWYRQPLLTGRERYVGGQGSTELGGSVESGDTVDQSLNLLMWAEAVWFPAALVAGRVDPSAYRQMETAGSPLPRWEPLDEHSARLVVPLRMGGEQREDELLAHFDPLSGRMTHVTAQRFRAKDGEQEKEPWRVDLLAWKHLGGALLPVHLAVGWGEGGSPGAYWLLEGIAYNVDVSERIP